MDIGVYSIDNIDNNKIKTKIDNQESFILKDISISFFGETIDTVENIIEEKGLTCRVYTKGRASTIAAAAIPTPVTVLSGWASGLFIGAHNLATWDPDYEIAKNPATSTLTITYKK